MVSLKDIEMHIMVKEYIEENNVTVKICYGLLMIELFQQQLVI